MKTKQLVITMLFASLLVVGCTRNEQPSSSLANSESTSTNSQSSGSSSTTSSSPSSVESSSTSSSSSEVVVTGIKIDAPANTTIVKGDTLQLAATLTPSEANKKITWSSSDDEIATVSDSGLVTTKGVGEVTITASVPAGDMVKSDSIDLVINPNVREVLNGLSTEVALTGTYKQKREDSAVVSIDSKLNFYFNNKAGSQEYYLQEMVDEEEVDARHYYGNAKGELVRYQINRLNEVEETNFVHQGDTTNVLFDDFISKFSDIKDDEVTIKSPSELEIALSASSAAKDLIYSLSFYETDLTSSISILLDQFGEPINIKLEGSYVDADYDYTFVQSLDLDVVSKDSINVPSKITPYPSLTGTDATLVTNFLDGLKNRNYTLDILVDDVSTINGQVTPNNVLMSDSSNSSRYFSFIADKGVYEVSYNDTDNSITPRSETNIASTMDEFLTPIDFSKDLFSPIGNDTYKLLYGLDATNLLVGLDPSIPFFSVYNSIYTIRNLDSVNITLEHDGDKITSATMTYDGRLQVYLAYDITIKITNIGTTTVPFTDATVKEYVKPTSWSTLDNNWYQNVNDLLGAEIDNVPFMDVEWKTYLEKDSARVQTNPMVQQTADSLLASYQETLADASWTKTDDVYSDKGTTIFDGVYSKTGEDFIIAVDEFTSGSDYYLQIVFLPSSYFNVPTSWEEVDSSWYSDLCDYLGDDVAGVPFMAGNWEVYEKSFDYWYAEIEFNSLEEYNAFVPVFLELFEDAGWYESEDYIDNENEEMVYENDDYSFFVYIDATANEEREYYYLDINFLNEDDVTWA